MPPASPRPILNAQPGLPGGPAAGPREVDAASCAAFRVLFGLLLAAAVVRYFAHGWIASQFEVPTFFFAYEGLEWLRPLPAPWMRAVFALLGVCALLIAVGLFYRLAAALFALGFTYVHFCDQANYLNHYWLVSLLAGLMVFLPLHRCASLDALRRPRWAKRTVHPVVPWVLRGQLILVYVFAGIAKLQGDWLLRGEPLHTWLSATEDAPLVGGLLGRRETALAASWGGALFDLAVPWLVLWRPTRPWAFGLLVLFHALTAWLLPIGLFPVFMTAFATILLPFSWPRWRPGAPSAPGPDLPPRDRLSLPARVALGAWLGLQLWLPMRHLAEDDDVLWGERGFRFSWRVMVFDKSGHARFELRDPGRGRVWDVRPEDELSPVQARQMSTQPDMVLAYGRHLADRARAAGHPRVEVRADVRVSFNGRPSRALVDPTLDLAAVPRGVWPRGWVTPPP